MIDNLAHAIIAGASALSWKVVTGFISATNVGIIWIMAQSPSDITTLPGLGAVFAGVTIPFGVGWFWNRQYLAAKEQHNMFLVERVESLSTEVIKVYNGQSQERLEKIAALEEADMLREENAKLRKQLRQYESNESEG